MNGLGGNLSVVEYYTILEEVGVDAGELLRAENEMAAKAEFLANARLVRPRNVYQKIDVAELKKKQQRIRAILRRLDESGYASEKQYETLRQEFGRRWYVIELVLAARRFNQSSSRTEREKQALRFRRANEAVYGTMHADTFWSLLGERLARIEPAKMSNDDKALYAEMMARIGVIKRSRKRRYAPKPETVRAFGKKVRGMFENILRHIPEGRDSFSAQDVADITNEIIEQEIGRWDAATRVGTRYLAKVDKERSTAVVLNGEQQILYPGKRSAGKYTRKEAEKIIIHEFGVHVMRSLSAEHQDLRAFYENAVYSRLTEEGLAKVCEQALDGKYDDIGILRYLAIGFVAVMGKGFRDCYEILWRMEKMLGGRNQAECFDLVQRAVRGTGILPINTDLSYYRGVNLVWKYIEEHLNDIGLMQILFLSGKTDFLKQDARRLLNTMREDGLIK